MPQTKVSLLSPVDPSTLNDSHEKEQEASWVSRQIAGSLTGRIIKSSYESLKATGNTVVCLSPWGDQSPLILPCIRFRDLAVESVLAATGGTASIATPVGADFSDAFIPSTGGSNILAETISDIGFTVADDMITGKPVDDAIEAVEKIKKRENTRTTAVKTISITLKYKISTKDASLGFFRSSEHQDSDLFMKMKDYLDIEKGWFSPYLFASNRRPVIPRGIHPDFVFCHGPFLKGDYEVGQKILQESAVVVNFSDSNLPLSFDDQSSKRDPEESFSKDSRSKLSTIRSKIKFQKHDKNHGESSINDQNNTQIDSCDGKTSNETRRMVILPLGIQPYRKLWSSCARPEESVMNYLFFNGCPAIVVPTKTGSPLVTWSAFTLGHLWKTISPTNANASDVQGSGTSDDEVEKMLKILFEFIELCVDWDRVEYGDKKDDSRIGLREALHGLLMSTMQVRDCDEANKIVDPERSGIAMWRIP